MTDLSIRSLRFSITNVSNTDTARATRDSAPRGKTKNATQSTESPKKQDQYTPEDQARIQELKRRDAEVRAHERAHLAAAGAQAAGGASYEYTDGPDGKRYATGGEVPISVGGGNTPQEKLHNAEVAIRAALAPANPSSSDQAIAAEARSIATKAREELLRMRNSGASESSPTGVAPNESASPQSNAASPLATESKNPKDEDSSSLPPLPLIADSYLSQSQETPTNSLQSAVDRYA